jgi:hypothetical protein
MWMQYILDTCETVDEVIATDSQVRIDTVDHYLVADRYGGVATIEFLAGEMVAHTGPELCVAALTNSTCAQSCALWEALRPYGNYSGLGNSIERFCIVADRVDAFQSTTTSGAVAYAFDTLHEVGTEYWGITRWSIVFDTKNLRAYFQTQRNPEIRWLDLDAFDLRCGRPAKMLDINQNLSGDVAGAFFDYDSDLNLAILQGYLDRWNIPYHIEDLRWVVRHFEDYPCVQIRQPRGRRVSP